MPWEYMFYSKISVPQWWFGYHDLPEMASIVALSSARMVFSIGEALGGQMLLIICALGMYWYAREHRDLSFPLAVPLSLLPQFLWVYFHTEDDLGRYLARALPVVLIFLAIAVRGLSRDLVDRLDRARGWKISPTPVYVAFSVLTFTWSTTGALPIVSR